MAVTGDIFKSLTFDGESSRDYGVYITGQAVYNAPERDVEMVTIPGRNGAFALDKGRFENIEVTYPAGVFANTDTEFAKAISDFRNMLCSRVGYCRLTDEYNPDEYRLAVYKSGLEVDPVQLKAGQFDITFECKPQRYLMSGQNRFLVTDWNDTTVETGKLISVDDTSGTNGIKDITVDIVPKQDGIPFMTTPIERTPFLFKQTPDSWEKKNTGKYTTLVGADVAVNQLVENGNFANSGAGWSSGQATVTFNNNECVMTATDSYPQIYRSGASVVKDHKYLITFDGKIVGSADKVVANIASSIYAVFTCTSTYERKARIMSATSTATGLFLFNTNNATVGDVTSIRNINIIDLTQMLGATIADTAYTKEQATAGSGIAWLKSQGFDFSKYIAFNSGTMQSVDPTKMITRGWNQWDEEWELGVWDGTGSKVSANDAIRCKNRIRVLPNTEYYFKLAPNMARAITRNLDANGNFISTGFINQSATFTTGANVHYIVWCTYSADNITTYTGGLCINLSKTTGTPKNGDYLAYNAHTYDIASYPLNGIFKLDNGNIVADGDVRESGRTIHRRYNTTPLDLGSVTWASGFGGFYTTAIQSLCAIPTTNANSNIISDAYPTNREVSAPANTIRIIPTGTYGGLLVITTDDYSDAAAFKTAMNGHYLYYELATPYDETITTGFTNPQVVEEYGTEEFVTSNDVPVGNQTRYGEIYPVSGTDKVHTVVSANLLDESTIMYHKRYVEYGPLVDSTTQAALPKIPLNGHDRLVVSSHYTTYEGGIEYRIYAEDGTKLFTWSGLPLKDYLPNNRVGMIIDIDYDTYPTAYSVGINLTASNHDVEDYIDDVMVTYSETYVDYLPYGTEYESDFEQNIWGGPFALLSGTGDSEYGTVDLGTLTWELIYNQDGARVFGATISDMEEPPDQSYNNTGLYSNAYALTDYIITDPHTTWIGPCRMLRIGHTVYIEDVNFTDADEFKKGVSGIELIYKLDEALEISYTALSLNPLEQTVNYIWNKENYDITVEYGTSPGFIVNPTLFGCGPLIETKGYGNISFNGRTISLANGAIGTVNLWGRTSGGSLNGSVTKTFGTGQFNPTDTFSFRVTHMFTLYEDNPSITNTNANATNSSSDNNDGSVTYTIQVPCTFTINTSGQITNKSTYTFGSKEVIANMTVSYNSATGTVVYSVTTDTVNNPEFASSTMFGFTLWECNAVSTLDRLGNPTYIDCDLGEAYKINDGDVVSLNSFVDLGSNLPELAPGANLFSVDNTFSEVAVVPRWWTV